MSFMDFSAMNTHRPSPSYTPTALRGPRRTRLFAPLARLPAWLLLLLCHRCIPHGVVILVAAVGGVRIGVSGWSGSLRLGLAWLLLAVSGMAVGWLGVRVAVVIRVLARLAATTASLLE